MLTLASEDVITKRAALRERMDALAKEVEQYEALHIEITSRIVANRVQLELARRELAALRGGR